MVDLARLVDLARWLGECLDEDERIARACSGMEWWEHPKNWVSAPPLNRIAVVVHDGDRGHIVEHDPARVLREIDAKRQLLAHVVEQIENAEVWWLEGVLTPVLKHLAAPYSGRPGFREEWAP